MKVESYLQINFTPKSEYPLFDLSFNVDDATFRVLDLTEGEIEEIIRELQDMLELLMGVYDTSKQKVNKKND